ncbi:hypothetical protein ACFVSW_05045 [Neobacillus sp. NPDC058068]|uniref:hypothetical protein n=1 Tax=Neobacillus sp. NPDC058068 TaxID=3346325 RepID=UPI0036DBD7AF
MRKLHFISTFIITLVLTFSLTIPVFTSAQVAAAGQNEVETSNLSTINTAIARAVNSIKQSQSGINSEWEAVGIARSGEEVPSSYYEDHFLSTLDSQVINASRVKITDVERLVIAASAIGKDPTNLYGMNLVEKIYNSVDWTPGTDSMTAQGINGPIFALIALDSQPFDIPANAKWTKEKLLNELLSRQNADGSWSLFGTSPSYDMTAMALIAIAPYKSQENVRTTIDRAVQFLSAKQATNGGFNDPFVGGVSSETTSQVIIALSSAGIDPTSAAFTKEGNNLLSHLLSFQYTDGGFKHIQSQNKADAMATEQALQALVAYKLFLEEGGYLYQFPPETKPTITVEGVEDGQTVNDEQLNITVTALNGKGENITHTLTFNDSDLATNAEGHYTLQLREGLNTITVTASSKKDTTIQTYQVTYEKIGNDDSNVPPAGNDPDVPPAENDPDGSNPTDNEQPTDPSDNKPDTTDQPETTDTNNPDNSIKPNQDNGQSVETGTVSTNSSTGNGLPKTASQQWNLILLGALLTLIGAVIYSLRNLKLKMNK